MGAAFHKAELSVGADRDSAGYSEYSLCCGRDAGICTAAGCGCGHLSHGVCREQETGPYDRVCCRNLIGHSVYHLRPRGDAVFLPVLRYEDISLGGGVYPCDHESAYGYAHDAGESEYRTTELPGGRLQLGAGKWRVIRTVVLPGCIDGVITGCILSVGRILGESAALLFTAGFAHALHGIFEGLNSAGATLTVALYVYAKENGEFGIAFAIAAILMLLTVVINLSATLAGRYFQKKARGVQDTPIPRLRKRSG